MQVLVPKYGSLLMFRSRNRSIASSFVAYFRSTPISFEKRNNKWNNFSDFGGQKPSKTFVKYKTRQKRANSKKALNDFLFRSGCSKFTLDGEYLNKQETIKWDADPTYTTNHKNNSGPQKSSARRARNSHQRRKKSKPKKGSFFEEFDEDDEDPWTHFQAKFGNRSYSWSFKSWEESFSQSQTDWSSSRNNKWTTASDDESDDVNEPYGAGSHSDRVTLGLPINGPLKIEEVKSAFRLSALKWHPDKHQGPSQALAEEKFKVCVNAYKSLCSSLSTV